MPAARKKERKENRRMQEAPAMKTGNVLIFVTLCLLIGCLALVSPVMAEPDGVAEARANRAKQEREAEKEQENVDKEQKKLGKANHRFRMAKTEVEIATGSLKRFEEDHKSFVDLLKENKSGFGGAVLRFSEFLGFDEFSNNRAMIRGAWSQVIKARARLRKAQSELRLASDEKSRVEFDLYRAKNRLKFHKDMAHYYDGLVRKLSKSGKKVSKAPVTNPNQDAASNLNDLFGEWNNLIRENQNSLRDKTREANQEDEVIRKEQNPDSLEHGQSNGGNINNNAHPCPPYCS